jgi:hypothetical protein
MERTAEEASKIREILGGHSTDLPFSLNALQVRALSD